MSFEDTVAVVETGDRAVELASGSAVSRGIQLWSVDGCLALPVSLACWPLSRALLSLRVKALFWLCHTTPRVALPTARGWMKK